MNASRVVLKIGAQLPVCLWLKRIWGNWAISRNCWNTTLGSWAM